MSILETLRYEYNTLKIALDTSKEVLAEVIEAQEELGLEGEMYAIFALKEAECNYFIAEAEENLELLKKEIDRLEAQARGN